MKFRDWVDSDVSGNPPGMQTLPRTVLLCHTGDKIDTEGLAVWLADTLNLVGIIKIREKRGRMIGKLRRELKRIGLFRLLDVIAFRIYYRLVLASRDRCRISQMLNELQTRYRADLARIPVLEVVDPNVAQVRTFLETLHTNLLVARCKFILKQDVFDAPTHGTYILHPGICPEYRNAHGCFWALTNRELVHVGMTLLKANKGVDTGPVLLQAGCKFDERHESHVVIQYRVILDNLESIREKLLEAWQGRAQPLTVTGRRSATWGQPWLSAYLKWKLSAARAVK